MKSSIIVIAVLLCSISYVSSQEITGSSVYQGSGVWSVRVEVPKSATPLKTNIVKFSNVLGNTTFGTMNIDPSAKMSTFEFKNFKTSEVVVEYLTNSNVELGGTKVKVLEKAPYTPLPSTARVVFTAQSDGTKSAKLILSSEIADHVNVVKYWLPSDSSGSYYETEVKPNIADGQIPNLTGLVSVKGLQTRLYLDNGDIMVIAE